MYKMHQLGCIGTLIAWFTITNLNHAHGDMIIGDSDTLEKKVIDLDKDGDDNAGAKVEEDSIVFETVDLAQD
jgi:hypothetical protein